MKFRSLNPKSRPIMKIQHSFPILGQIEVPLHNESGSIFELLSRLPMAGAQHWQGLDHLGELRNVLKCGHHSRYEYLLLQLYLIHIFKERARGFGLSSKVALPNGAEISSAEELLKCWAMLDEFGHLKGTYESERFLLHVLCTRKDCASHFIAAFIDPQAVEYAKSVVETEDLWGLHRAISLLALETYRSEYAKESDAISQSIQILHALVVPSDDEGLRRNRRYFSRIRRLTHIYLDTANLPTYVHFQPAILFQKIADAAALFLEESNDATNRMISGILDYLQDEIYASVQANKYKLNRMDGLLARFEEVETTNRSPIRNSFQLSKWILSAKGGEFWGYKEPNVERHHRLRLRMVSDGYFNPDHVKVISGAEKFHRLVKNTRWSTIITSYEGPLGHSCFLDLYDKNDTRSYSYGGVFTALLGFLRDCYSSHVRLPQVFNWLCEERFVDLLKFALNCVLPSAHKYRFVKTQSFSEFTVDLIEPKIGSNEVVKVRRLGDEEAKARYRPKMGD